MRLTVVKSLQKQKSLALYPDVSALEMRAIGKMTVSWALLEYQLMNITLELSKHASHILPTDFEQNSSLRRILEELKTVTVLISKLWT